MSKEFRFVSKDFPKLGQKKIMKAVEAGAKYLFVLIHRQWGKSKFARKLSQEYLFDEDSPWRQVGIWCSQLNQALRIYRDEYKKDYAHFGPIYEDSLNRLYFKKNLDFLKKEGEWFPLIDFYDTSYNPDPQPGQAAQSKRGGTYAILFLDEYGTYKEGYAQSVAYPMRDVWQGPIFHMGTPLGPGNFKTEFDHAKMQMKKGNHLYYAIRQTIEDSLHCGDVTKKFYDEVKARCMATKVGWQTWLAEYMLDWYAYVPDRIFGIEVSQAYSDKRVGVYPANLVYTVDTVWDIGKNGTVCWVFQCIGGQIRYVEFFEELENVHLQSFILKHVRPLTAKYNFRHHFWPFDIVNTDYTQKESRFDIVRKLLPGKHHVGKVVRKPEELIDKARRNFRFACFDKEKVRDGLSRLSLYKMKNGKPFKDPSSHGSDAFTYSQNLLELYGISHYDAEPLSHFDIFGNSRVKQRENVSRDLKGAWWSA